jgi:hypothetical protein
MKIILPSLLIGLFSASFALAQGPAAPPASAPSSAVAPVEPRVAARQSPAGFQLPDDPSTPVQAEPADGGELLMRRVHGLLASTASISSRVRYRVDLFGHQLVGEGIYLQQGAGDKQLNRLELKTLVGQHVEVVQMVGDGKYLWQYQDSGIPPTDPTVKPQVARIDLARVRLALHHPQAFHGRMLTADLALAGLERLIEGLAASYHFERIEAGKLDTLPVWIATGTWRPETLVSVSKDLADQATNGQPLDLKKLPPQMPEEVQLFIGQEDMFPYRIEYRRRPQKQGKGEAIGDMAPILIVEFYEVRLNETIGPQNFVYQPGNAEIADATANFIKSMGVRTPADKEATTK